jgi:hypothetical protein
MEMGWEEHAVQHEEAERVNWANIDIHTAFWTWSEESAGAVACVEAHNAVLTIERCDRTRRLLVVMYDAQLGTAGAMRGYVLSSPYTPIRAAETGQVDYWWG